MHRNRLRSALVRRGLPVRLDRAGFSLAEMIVAVAIMATMAAVVGVRMAGTKERGDAALLAKNLDGLNQAITAFRNDVGRYPSQLVYLTAPLPSNATDACGQAIPEVARSEWRGPYLSRPVEATGIMSGRATIRNTTRRDPTLPPPSFATFFVEALNVDRSVANEVEAAVDGNASFTTGAVRWAEQGTTGAGTLSLAVPISGC